MIRKTASQTLPRALGSGARLRGPAAAASAEVRRSAYHEHPHLLTIVASFPMRRLLLAVAAALLIAPSASGQARTAVRASPLRHIALLQDVDLVMKRGARVK